MIKLVYDEIHWLHSDPGGHPESPDRIEAILGALRKRGYLSEIELLGTLEHSIEDLRSVHSEEYVRWIEGESRRGFHYVDSDTYVTEHSFEVAARFSSTAKRVGLESYRENEISIILARPPGHHAGLSGRAMGAPTLGFCIFNHVAVLSKSLLELEGRVLVVDFDLHHGNGTQEIFWNDGRVIHVDVHQRGIYPGSGGVSDVGGRGARGSKVNVPLEPGSGDEVYAWILDRVVGSLVEKYRPRAIVVSAGFDSYAGEPMSGLLVTDRTYYLYGSYFRSLCDDGVVKSVVSVLEGGYGAGLRKGFLAYFEGLAGVRREFEVKRRPPERRVYEYLRKAFSEHHCLEI